jgi:hypothetical protein
MDETMVALMVYWLVALLVQLVDKLVAPMVDQ